MIPALANCYAGIQPTVISLLCLALGVQLGQGLQLNCCKMATQSSCLSLNRQKGYPKLYKYLTPPTGTYITLI